MIVDLAERAAAGGRLAIDTEFVSERRYQALLCLAQVAVPDPDVPGGVRTEVLDPIAHELDPAPLAEVLADPAIEIVVHAGRQDVAILRRSWNTEITNVFDTQIAAGFLGLGNQEGYESLVRKVLKVKLKGSEGFTRWDKRPLTEQQLEYAADDARLLLELGTELERRLTERGRLDWAREECLVVSESNDERSADRAYERLPRIGRLSDSARAVARELAECARTPPAARTARRARSFPIRRSSSSRAGHRATGTASSRSVGCRRPRSTAAATLCSRRSSAASSAPLPRRPPSCPRASPPTLRSSRSPRRSCATAHRSPRSPSS